MQRCVGKFHLRFHTGGADQSAAAGSTGNVVRQRRLPHAGLAMEHQHSAPGGPHVAQHPVQQAAFGAAINQLRHGTRGIITAVSVYLLP